MSKILNISIVNSFPEDKRKIGRSTGSSDKVAPEQWPRLYGRSIKQSIKAKCWELRNYAPKVIQL